MNVYFNFMLAKALCVIKLEFIRKGMLHLRNSANVNIYLI